MSDGRKREYLASAGNIYSDSLAGESDDTLDETLEALGRILADDEGAYWFISAISEAALQILTNAGLPTEDRSDLLHLEWCFEGYCNGQPKKPRPKGQRPAAEEKREWEISHSAYWESLKDDPAVRLFSDEKLLAAYRLQEAAATLSYCLHYGRAISTMEWVIKFMLLATRCGALIEYKNVLAVMKERTSKTAKEAGKASGESRNDDIKDRNDDILKRAKKMAPSGRSEKREVAGKLAGPFLLKPGSIRKILKKAGFYED